jgi:hypothetical protein
MTRRKPLDNRRKARSAKAAPSDPVPEDRIVGSPPSLHDLFQQEARRMLDRADLEEEQKQSILLAMSCPCCGAGAMSYTVKLKR